MALAIADFFSPPPTKRPPADKSTISQKLKKLFSQVDQQFADEELQAAESFEGLVEQLAEIELTGGDNLPSDESIRDVLKTAGKTTGDLDQAVERHVKAAKLRQELSSEPDAIDALDDIKETIRREDDAWKKTFAAREARTEQLRAELTARQMDRDHFRQVREQLISLVGSTSEREIEIVKEIRELGKQEHLTRSRAGSLGLLPEKYIGAALEDSAEFKEWQTLEARIKAAEEGDAKSGNRGFSRYASYLRGDLYPKQKELTATVERARQLYALGAVVVAVREKRAALQEEKAALESQRRAAVESGQ